MFQKYIFCVSFAIHLCILFCTVSNISYDVADIMSSKRLNVVYDSSFLLWKCFCWGFCIYVFTHNSFFIVHFFQRAAQGRS